MPERKTKSHPLKVRAQVTLAYSSFASGVSCPPHLDLGKASSRRQTGTSDPLG